MTQQIEPIEIFGRENRGVFLRVHRPLLRDDISKAEILDTYGNTLFTSILTAKTIEEVAKQLNLTLKTMNNTKELLTEIMKADAKDGLYKKETLEEAADKYFPFAEKIGGETYTAYKGFIEGAKWQQEHGQEVGQIVQVDVIDLIQFLSMNQEFNGYGSVSKETAKYFLEQYKKK